MGDSNSDRVGMGNSNSDIVGMGDSNSDMVGLGDSFGITTVTYGLKANVSRHVVHNNNF